MIKIINLMLTEICILYEMCLLTVGFRMILNCRQIKPQMKHAFLKLTLTKINAVISNVDFQILYF